MNDHPEHEYIARLLWMNEMRVTLEACLEYLRANTPSDSYGMRDKAADDERLDLIAAINGVLEAPR